LVDRRRTLGFRFNSASTPAGLCGYRRTPASLDGIEAVAPDMREAGTPPSLAPPEEVGDASFSDPMLEGMPELTEPTGRRSLPAAGFGGGDKCASG
jgi:hypothetical protein